jgi:hypothetical protein
MLDIRSVALVALALLSGKNDKPRPPHPNTFPFLLLQQSRCGRTVFFVLTVDFLHAEMFTYSRRDLCPKILYCHLCFHFGLWDTRESQFSISEKKSSPPPHPTNAPVKDVNMLQCVENVIVVYKKTHLDVNRSLLRSLHTALTYRFSFPGYFLSSNDDLIDFKLIDTACMPLTLEMHSRFMKIFGYFRRLCT